MVVIASYKDGTNGGAKNHSIGQLMPHRQLFLKRRTSATYARSLLCPCSMTYLKQDAGALTLEARLYNIPCARAQGFTHTTSHCTLNLRSAVYGSPKVALYFGTIHNHHRLSLFPSP